MGVLICQGGITSPGFFAISYFIGTLIVLFFKGGHVELKDVAWLIIVSLIVMFVRMFL